jgi:signal transduction histidine kinase
MVFLLALALALAFALAVLGSGAPGTARAQTGDVPPPRVLVLFPSEPGDTIAALLEQGLRETLRAGGGGVAPPVLLTEYLEIARLPEPALQRAQLEWLRRKYADHPPDVVVAFGTSTARRLELLEAPLFAGVPSVFAALDPLLFPDLALPSGADALWLRYDVGETLGAALRLQPAARRAVLVAGTSDFDRAMLALARREVAPYAPRVAVEEITDLPLEEMLRRLAALPPEAVVVYLSLNLDGAGTPLATGEGLRRVLAASGAPVYSNTETSVGSGVVGGAVTSYATVGGAAARDVLRRLADPAALPVREAPPSPRYVFDWRQLQRWGLREGRLPPGSVVLHKPPSLWDQYRGPAAGALAVGAAQGALIAGLLVERRHRRRAQEALAERQQDLQESNARLQDSNTRLQESNARVRGLAGQLLVAQERERAQIARELHDEVGQALTTVKINLDTMRLMGAGGAGAPPPPGLLDEGVALVDGALEQVRDLSLLLRPALLDHLGLVAALRSLLHGQAQRVGYQVTFSAGPLLPAPTAEQELICYRVAQEALTNVARHARASHVTLEVGVHEDQLRLTVRDDGVGFDPQAERLRARAGGSLGLLSLEERAALGGGTLAIDSAPGRGTTLVLALPVSSSQPGPAGAPATGTLRAGRGAPTGVPGRT